MNFSSIKTIIVNECLAVGVECK